MAREKISSSKHKWYWQAQFSGLILQVVVFRGILFTEVVFINRYLFKWFILQFHHFQFSISTVSKCPSRTEVQTFYASGNSRSDLKGANQK